MVDLAGDVEEEARGRRIRPSLAASGGPVLEFFFFTFFWSPEAVVLAAAARRSHEGSGLVAEVLGGGFGRRTPPRSMGAAAWGPRCAVEMEMILIGIELGSFFCFHFCIFLCYLSFN